MASEICGHHNEVCYGEDSPWQNMLGRDVKILMLGVSFYYASIIHVAELECQVPYRFWKSFTNKITNKQSKIDFTVELYAAELEITRHYDKLLDLVEVKNHIFIPENINSVFLISLDILYDEAVRVMKQDSNYFISHNA